MTWVAAERVASRRYVRHPDSPEFADVGALMRWLEERGLIKRYGGPREEGGYRGWGDPWFAVPTEKAATAD